jgi:hypothetical protein
MSLLYFRLDQKAIMKALEEKVAYAPEVQAKANRIVLGLFGRAQVAMIKNFLEHPVTLELKAGASNPDTANISETLNGEGNLFGFLGFFQGQDPTFELEDLLSRISCERSSIRKNVIFYKITNYPTKKAIESASEMNWGKTSWALAIETGNFDGDAALSHYIFRSGAGRSGAGIQVKGYEYSEERFQPRPYISEILEKFQDQVNNSSSKFLV